MKKEAKRINDNVIQINSAREGKPVSYLYDEKEEKRISRIFSSISEFEITEDGTKIAVAKDCYPYNDGTNNVFYLACIINEKGEIISDLVSLFDESRYDFSKIGYAKLSKLIVKGIQDRMQEQSLKNEKVLTKLKADFNLKK